MYVVAGLPDERWSYYFSDDRNRYLNKLNISPYAVRVPSNVVPTKQMVFIVSLLSIAE